MVSDDHKGLVRAIQTHFQGATWQRCQTHFTRNILDACPKTLQGEFHGKLRLVFEAPGHGHSPSAPGADSPGLR
ncbi:MAG: transposase [Bacillota bacterium]